MKPYAPLSKSDNEIVKAINAGCCTTKQIATYLRIPIGTLYSRLGYIKSKFGVETLYELIKAVKE